MAVTANQLKRMRMFGGRIERQVLAAKHLWAGTLGYLVAASGYLTDVIAAGANRFGGVVCNEVDNSAGASGDKVVDCYTKGFFIFSGSGFTLADEGKLAYGVDNFTVSITATNQSPVGKISKYISATEVEVDIADHAL